MTLDAPWVALIRGIGPTTHRVMPLRDLRNRCEEAGLLDVQSILATGNLLFWSTRLENEIMTLLERAVGSFGLKNSVMLRRPEQLTETIRKNPFPDAAKKRPAQLLVLFLPSDAEPTAQEVIARQAGPERVLVAGREVYIDYRAGVARSKLSPAFLERALGQSGTARNWNTIVKLLHIMQEREDQRS